MPDNHIYFYIDKAVKGYGSLYLLIRRSSANFRKVSFVRELRLKGNYFGEINFALSTVFFGYKPCQETLRSVLYMRINISLLEALPLQTW